MKSKYWNVTYKYSCALIVQNPENDVKFSLVILISDFIFFIWSKYKVEGTVLMGTFLNHNEIVVQKMYFFILPDKLYLSLIFVFEFVLKILSLLR